MEIPREARSARQLGVGILVCCLTACQAPDQSEERREGAIATKAGKMPGEVVSPGSPGDSFGGRVLRDVETIRAGGGLPYTDLSVEVAGDEIRFSYRVEGVGLVQWRAVGLPSEEHHEIHLDGALVFFGRYAVDGNRATPVEIDSGQLRALTTHFGEAGARAFAVSAIAVWSDPKLNDAVAFGGYGRGNGPGGIGGVDDPQPDPCPAVRSFCSGRETACLGICIALVGGVVMVGKDIVAGLCAGGPILCGASAVIGGLAVVGTAASCLNKCHKEYKDCIKANGCE